MNCCQSRARAGPGADDAKCLSVALAAPHHKLPEFQRHSNYTYPKVIWAFEFAISGSATTYRIAIGQ